MNFVKSFPFRSSTDEQRLLIFSIFDRVAKLQNLVISEVSLFKSMSLIQITLSVAFILSVSGIYTQPLAKEAKLLFFGSLLTPCELSYIF